MRAAIRNEFKEGTRGSGASPSRGGYCPFIFSDDVATGSSSVVALMVKHRSVSDIHFRLTSNGTVFTRH